ncbi:MAG: hypothetical protein GY936_02725 [Ignavibacteriae bacterium]|nr:hypothetical protein [Ignavibacteriota bacterium]
MNLAELKNNYYLNDGAIRNIEIIFDSFNNKDFCEANISVILQCRKVERQEKALIKLKFLGNIFYDLFDENLSLSSSGNYSDITLLKNENERFYLSLDPYLNDGIPNDKDNDIIISDKIEISILGKTT